jgi:two-component system OmpR family response regulator
MHEERFKPSRILLVDDDEEIRLFTSNSLNGPEFDIITAADGVEMYQILAKEQVDLIVLDLSLPGQDGLTLCRDVSSRLGVPIVLLTARGGAIDRIIGLEMGADDYVSKPFETRELAARIRNILRRTHPTGAHHAWAKEAHFEGWTLHLKQRHLTDPSGCMVMLSGAEFRLLEILVENANKVLSREFLAASEGYRVDPGRRAIDNLISRLRQKLAGPTDSHHELIKTVRGSGYVFASEVSLV